MSSEEEERTPTERKEGAERRRDGGPAGPEARRNSCPARPVLSADEERVLRRMRELKERLRRLRATGGPDPGELEALRREFAACREALRQANRDKWIALGYEVD